MADDGRTALHLAASTGNHQITELLISVDADVNAADRWGGTPLRDAVREGRKEVAAALREAGGELGYDEVAASGELCELAKRGSPDLLQVLLDCGCSVNAADYDARTCLHLAASTGNLRICSLLADANADLNAVDRWGGALCVLPPPPPPVP